MKARSERGAELGVPKGAAIYGDLEDVRVSRAVWIVDEEEDAMRVHAGDLQAVLDAGEGLLVRYVVFPGEGDLDAMAAAYAEGFGELGRGMNEAGAVMVDDEDKSIVSLTVWRDQGALDAFLGHAGFAAAKEKLAPHTSGEPRAENLKVI